MYIHIYIYIIVIIYIYICYIYTHIHCIYIHYPSYNHDLQRHRSVGIIPQLLRATSLTGALQGIRRGQRGCSCGWGFHVCREYLWGPIRIIYMCVCVMHINIYIYIYIFIYLYIYIFIYILYIYVICYTHIISSSIVLGFQKCVFHGVI